MDCMPLRPGPFHYLISEQAKSLVALQELQNEVGALLEFRDLVIETFPNLRQKMAITATASDDTGTSSPGNGTTSVLMSSSQGSHIPLPLSSQSPSSRQISEWEPGKVRRRVAQSRENESSSSSLPRSRSNSHSGGNKHSATVQDSGFSTETSSKDSASTAIPRPQSPSSRPVLDEAEDELWNLLDVIHRKGVRLREEVESLQGRLESVAPVDVPSDILEAVHKVTGHSEHLDLPENDLLLDDQPTSQVALLQHEKLQLLDKVAELEAETISSKARAHELQSEIATLSAIRTCLEERLKMGLEAEDCGILVPGAQRIQPIEPTAPTLLQSPRGSGATLNIKSKESAFASVVSGTVSGKTAKNRFRTRTIEKNVLANVAASHSIEDMHVTATSDNVNERRARLGALDSVLISPSRVIPQVRRDQVDSRKIAAILREHSPLELQRHLITTTVHNQVLQKRLDEIEKSSETLSERLGKAHEENEDLRFQLAERNIELEGTRARVRVLERLQQRPTTENDADDESEPQPMRQGSQQIVGMDVGIVSSNSNSESSSNASQGAPEPEGQLKPSPRRRPSRIPLLGATKTTPAGPPSHRRNDSRDSLKSLGGQRSSANPSLSSNRHVVARSGRDSSRESLGKSSLPKAQGQPALNLNRSLPRNGSVGKDSLGRHPANSSFSRPRDSLEIGGGSGQTSGTPLRRPPASARRSQAQATKAATASVGDNGADTGKSMQSSNPPSSWLSSELSLYPDSLNSIDKKLVNKEAVERTPRRVEFIIGSPTRKRLFQTPCTVQLYIDSIDTVGIHENFTSDEYPPSHGEALAEYDSLECDEKLETGS